MNDFTKEELLIIKDAIKIYLRTPSPIEAEHLREKIESMIGNYCETNKIQDAFNSMHKYIEWLAKEDYYKDSIMKGFYLCYAQFVDAFIRRGLIPDSH